MANINFNATVSSLVKFEKESGKSIMKSLANDMSLTDMIILTKAMSNATDADIDEYVKENGFVALSNEIVKALEVSGFLHDTNNSVKK